MVCGLGSGPVCGRGLTPPRRNPNRPNRRNRPNRPAVGEGFIPSHWVWGCRYVAVAFRSGLGIWDMIYGWCWFCGRGLTPPRRNPNRPNRRNRPNRPDRPDRPAVGEGFIPSHWVWGCRYVAVAFRSGLGIWDMIYGWCWFCGRGLTPPRRNPNRPNRRNRPNRPDRPDRPAVGEGFTPSHWVYPQLFGPLPWEA